MTETESALTRVFWSGRSQAVRIPKEFRLPGDRARIRRVGHSLVVEPILVDWSWVDDVHESGGVDVDFERAVADPAPMPPRSPGEELFES